MSIETVRAITDEILIQCAQTVRPQRTNTRLPYVHTTKGEDPGVSLVKKLTLLAGELEKIDANDFPMCHRVDFLEKRKNVIGYANQSMKNQPNICKVVTELSSVLPHYGGHGSGGSVRDFAFIASADVRPLVERDFKELEYTLIPSKAWKSVIVMCGSILEAVLYDQLTKDATTIAAAMASPRAPTRSSIPGARCPTCNEKGFGEPTCATCNQVTKNTVAKDISSTARRNSWSLNDLIAVACDIGLLPIADENAVHLALREFRNFVHPRVEIRKGIPIAEGPAKTAHGMLITILDHLS